MGTIGCACRERANIGKAAQAWGAREREIKRSENETACKRVYITVHSRSKDSLMPALLRVQARLELARSALQAVDVSDI